jgi:hypothetical protein
MSKLGFIILFAACHANPGSVPPDVDAPPVAVPVDLSAERLDRPRRSGPSAHRRRRTPTRGQWRDPDADLPQLAAI